MDGQQAWWHPDDDTADAHYSTDDLFELVWQAKLGGGRGGGVRASSLRSTSYQVVPAISPPSEDVMASWLYPIVSAGGDALAQPPVVAKEASETPTTMADTKDTNRARNDDDSSEKKKKKKKKKKDSTTTSRKVPSSHHSGGTTHNLTEKKRRCRINERLRILRQLVPGCDKSNQASTLEQTIQYMKSLQQQVILQAMNTCRPPAPPPPPAMYPAALAMPPTFPFVAMLPYPHYQAAINTPAAAAGAPQYLQTQAGAAPGAPAHHTQFSVSMELHPHQHKKEKEGRRLCPT